MMMDADDCVHRDLAQHVNHYPPTDGWSMNTGYLWDEGSSWLYRTKNFAGLCGSSAIIRLLPEDFPTSESEASDRFFILTNGHSVINNYMAKRGTPLRPLPFIGSIYVTATGENDSAIRMAGWQGKKHAIGKLLAARPLTQRVRSEFGLYDLQRTSASKDATCAPVSATSNTI
jgi:hypothetical protein